MLVVQSYSFNFFFRHFARCIANVHTHTHTHTPNTHIPWRCCECYLEHAVHSFIALVWWTSLVICPRTCACALCCHSAISPNMYVHTHTHTRTHRTLHTCWWTPNDAYTSAPHTCAYIHARTQTNTHARTHTHTHRFAGSPQKAQTLYVCVFILLFVKICCVFLDVFSLCVCMYVYVCAYVRVFVCVCECLCDVSVSQERNAQGSARNEREDHCVEENAWRKVSWKCYGEHGIHTHTHMHACIQTHAHTHAHIRLLMLMICVCRLLEACVVLSRWLQKPVCWMLNTYVLYMFTRVYVYLWATEWWL